MITELKITVLANNRVMKKGLPGEHGWSLLLEADGHTFLWDTGQGIMVFLSNSILGNAGIENRFL